jgi:2-aminoadipate transaminase
MTIEDHRGMPGRGPGRRREQVRVATQERSDRSTSRDLERYAGLFASRTRVMKSSAMRDMMAVTARPEVISLAGGLPDTSSFPPDTFAALFQRIATESCARALQYGPTEGLDEVKARIAEVMGAEGMRADPGDVIVTTGGQQVIDLVTKTLIDPGDVVVAEAPTYPGAVPVFSSYQADLVQIEMDGDGMRIDLLEETLERLERDGRRPKFVYTVPTFQNPAGVTMSLERRRRLVEIAHERELLVLEDNPYGLLRYEGEAQPTLRALDRGVYTMYLGTFSKILSPGIRLGWVVAPPPVLEKINIGKQAADLCTSTLSQLMVEAYFQEGRWRDYIDSLAEIYRARRDTMLDALAEFLPPEADWTRPSGGLFIWVTLPDYIDTTDLLARALRENVAFVPGEGAYRDGRGRDSMRLNYSGVDEDSIREGVRRIGKVVDEQVALYGTLTGRGARTERRPRPEAEGRRPAAAAPEEDVEAPIEGQEGARIVELPRRFARES